MHDELSLLWQVFVVFTYVCDGPFVQLVDVFDAVHDARRDVVHADSQIAAAAAHVQTRPLQVVFEPFQSVAVHVWR